MILNQYRDQFQLISVDVWCLKRNNSVMLIEYENWFWWREKMNLGKIEWITFDVDGNPVLINVALEFMIIHSKMRCTNMCLRAFVHVCMAHNGQYITGTKWMKSICPATAQLDSKLEIVIWHCSQIHIIVGNSNHIYQNKYNVILRSKHKTKCIMFEICASVYLPTPLPLQCI